MIGQVGHTECPGHVGESEDDGHGLLGADDGNRHHGHARPHGDLDEAAAPEAPELVAVGIRLRRPLGPLGKDERQLTLFPQQPVGVERLSRHPAGAGPQCPEDGQGAEEVLGQAVHRALQFLLHPVHDHRSVRGDGAGMVGHEQGATLARDVLEPLPLGAEPLGVDRLVERPHHGPGSFGATPLVDVGHPRILEILAVLLADPDGHDRRGLVLLARHRAPVGHRPMVPSAGYAVPERRLGRRDGRSEGVARLGAGGPDEALGEDRGVRDGGARERSLNHRGRAVGPRAGVHDDVVDLRRRCRGCNRRGGLPAPDWPVRRAGGPATASRSSAGWRLRPGPRPIGRDPSSRTRRRASRRRTRRGPRVARRPPLRRPSGSSYPATNRRSRPGNPRRRRHRSPRPWPRRRSMILRRRPPPWPPQPRPRPPAGVRL